MFPPRRLATSRSARLAWQFACIATLAIVAVPYAGAHRAAAQGYAPDEAPRRMTVPDGFEVQLVASEPMVRQPVAIEFDDAGRLWVIQYLQYPNPAGLKRSEVDRYSRTKYDRVPEPPPHGPRGADRITILEDTNHDGRADKAKDFVAGLNLASGLAFGHGGVFVLQVPYLLFYPDRDRDDVPDGDPEVLLTGFGMEDAHSVANSLTWGPDGWLYGCQGSTVTANIRGIEFQQGVWRYHPLTKQFELFCEGGGNSWGLDFDRHGNLLYSTNHGGYAMLHGVQGGYYWKQFGKHGALHNPYAYGYFDHVPHQDLRGGHVTVGGLVYQSDLFPPEFRGKYIGADLLGHAVYWHELRTAGSTFTARHVGDLLLANDTWFAPSDMTVGPDGAVYVCDWHDQRTAHPDPDADWDRRNGRVYRIAPRLAPREKPQSLASLSSDQLIDMLDDAEGWRARTARRLLADRRDASIVERLRKQLAERATGAAPTLWALYVSGGFDEPLAVTLLDHPDPDVRSWTVRFLGDQQEIDDGTANRLRELAVNETQVAVRSQLACTAQRLPPAQALPIIEALVTHDEDAADPYLPLLLWWAVERHAVAAHNALLEAVCQPQVWQRPLMHKTVLPRLMRRYAADASRTGYLACAKLLDSAPEADRMILLGALDQGLDDRGVAGGGSAGTLFANLAGAETTAAAASDTDTAPVEVPDELLHHVERAWKRDSTDLVVLRLAARFGLRGALQHAATLAADANAPIESRVAALGILGRFGATAESSVEPVLQLLDAAEPPTVQQAALDALAAFDDPRIPEALLARYATAAEPLGVRIVDVLLGRRDWAARFLALVDEGKIAAKNVAVEQLRIVAVHEDDALDQLVKKHWGRVAEGTPEQRLAEMRRINNDLRAAGGDARAGKPLFAKTCGTCHRLFGEGNQVGPELTPANHKNTAEFLATRVRPSPGVRREYMNFVLQTTEGRVLTGLLVDQTPGSVTLLDAKNQRTTVPRARIETLQESPTSLMPDNLLAELKPQQLRDLFAYLQSDPPPDDK